jgi:hypothetical protein
MVRDVDSGCTDHCFGNRVAFESYQPFENREGTGVEGSTFRISGTGVVRKSTVLGGVKRVFNIDTLHTPDLSSNLISVSKLDEKGFTTTFSRGTAIIADPAGAAIMEAKLVNGMYVVELIDEGVHALATSTPRSRDVPVDKNTWHRRLGHVGKTGLDAIISGDRVEGMSVATGDDSGMCEDCLSGKQARRPFDGIHEPETEAGEREYLDITAATDQIFILPKILRDVPRAQRSL